VFPSDHFVSDDGAFMGHVERLAAVAERHPNRILLLGARPESPESAYGWIEPGGELDGAPAGGLRRVRRFFEKPPPEVARACMERGGLWNTFVMVAKVAAFIEAGRRVLPQLHERLMRASPFFETEAEPFAVDRAYAFAPTANFSQAVLGATPSALAVSVLPPLTWSDWGTPERVIETLRREGIAPGWLRDLAPDGVAPQPAAASIAASRRSTSSLWQSAVPGFITDAAAAATP
jgi:mannose-1-phosphate guanylyltransferase